MSRQSTKSSIPSFITLNVYTRYIDSKTGRRSDTAHHYIYNQVHNKNLKILVRRHVVRIIFEYVFIFSLLNSKIFTYRDFDYGRGTRAVGIEHVDDTIGGADGTTKPLVARASRLVVLSAGAFGSPSILERSGIGSKDVLTRNNVHQLVDLPGVGEHYMGSYNWIYQRKLQSSYQNSQDHVQITLPFVASEDAETMDELFRGTEEQLERTYATVRYY